MTELNKWDTIFMRLSMLCEELGASSYKLTVGQNQLKELSELAYTPEIANIVENEYENNVTKVDYYFND